MTAHFPPAPDDASPTFSVLVASYNQADYVRDTLDTVAAQTFTDFEIVVVNDGSTDRTEAVVGEWIDRFRERRGNRVVLANTSNGGQSAAMEHGFGLCTGRYVALLDSDDRWLPHKLQRVAEAIASDPEAGMIVHPLYVIDFDGRRTGDIRPKRARLSEGDLRQQIRKTSRQVAPATSGVVIRTDVFAGLVPMPTRRFRTAADMYLTLGASLLAPVRAVHEPLAEYRMHPGGAHIRSMLSPDGLSQWVEIQSAIIRHFGLEDAVARNSYFVRHEFALAKLRGGSREQLAAFGKLARATLQDGSFRPAARALFTGYWAACLLAPRPLFRGLWRSFQLRQTGFDKVGLEPAGTGRPASLPHAGSGEP